MIVRVIVKNIYSFNDETEFNFLPSQASRLKFHRYALGDKEVLKLSAMYGANGSGKSNLIKSVALLREFVTTGNIHFKLREQKYKLAVENLSLPVELGIEFYFKHKLFYYSIAINEGKVVEEYLCNVEGKDNIDNVIFNRTLQGAETKVLFHEGFMDERDNSVYANLITKDLLKANKSLLFLLNGLSHEAFGLSREAFEWFDEFLVIIFPETRVTSLPVLFDEDTSFKAFASDMMCSFGTGISDFFILDMSAKEYFGDNEHERIKRITDKLTENPETVAKVVNDTTGEEVHVVNKDGEIIAKRLCFNHISENNEKIAFNFHEESDGTRRLIEYIPAWYDLVNSPKTYLIDEIERSVHPIIIKELLTKFSLDRQTKGQLMFSTHESNLLDQYILRTDEIWFAQKNNQGATQIYSLSSYKEHSTIDIRKGYLNGRYGAIPFIANLQDLNWHKYAEQE
ncbi:ATP-binding protein [Pedobacter aquatilis]|uniref:AAA family ATPase n=1 Tax=Pedobacter aquatilis TaxID=351343 RepID=UPI0029305A0C|nr:ATP-binding protein [Pedobacter aquatilis]